MRSQYLLLTLCSTGCVPTIGASQASGRSQELQQVLIEPVQAESKMDAAQEQSKTISTDQMFNKLKEARQKLASDEAAQQQAAVQLYKAIVNLSTQYATAAQAAGRNHNELDTIASTALNNLGYCYELGKGVAQNTTHAFELYKQAVALGNLTKWWNYYALYNLARCYEKGIGTQQDVAEATTLLNQAYKWYSNFTKLYPMHPDKAFERGIQEALEALKKTEKGRKRSVSISFQKGKEPIEMGEYQNLE